MLAVVQRVSRARVKVEDEVVASVEEGLLVMVAVAPEDSDLDARWLAKKVAELRVFPAGQKEFHISVKEAGGKVLAVPEFTLLADASRGRRPSLAGAAPPSEARPIYDAFLRALEGEGVLGGSGVFGARMEVELVNVGPVTFIVESRGCG